MATSKWRLLVAACSVMATFLLAACSSSASSEQPASAGRNPTQTPLGTSALTTEVSAIRQALQSGVDAGAFPGAVVVVRRGSQSDTVAVGRADVAKRVPMTAADRFHIASVTKSMTAAVTLQLVAQGRLSLSDTVARWEPGLLAHGGDITVADLLGQTSGLPAFQATHAYLRMRPPYPPPKALVALVARAPLMFKPGTRSFYSNTNYVVLGLILEKVTHEPLPTLFQQRLFGPLGLHSASLAASRATTPPLAHGYDHGKDVTFTASDLTWLSAAGGVVSNAGDVARFYDDLFAGKIVPEALLHKMRSQRPETNHTDVAFGGYGLGIATLPTPCGPIYGHSGFDTGFFSDAWTTKDGKRSVVMVANATLSADSNDDLVAVVDEALCSP